MMVISGIRIYQLSQEYSEGIAEYEELEQYVSVTDDTRIEDVAEKQEDKAEDTEETEEQKKFSLQINVDYNALKAMNEDYMGWIYYEPLDISYPLVSGDDNTYYTTHTFEDKENSFGSIFLDFLNKPDFSDYNTIIYGHNMRNGTMFGSLKQGLNDMTIFDENPYFYIFVDEKIKRYQIFACYITNENSDTYTIVRDEEGQQSYLDYIKSVSEYETDGDSDNTGQSSHIIHLPRSAQCKQNGSAGGISG